MGITGTMFYLQRCLQYYKMEDYENALGIYQTHGSAFRELNLNRDLQKILQTLDTLQQRGSR